MTAADVASGFEQRRGIIPRFRNKSEISAIISWLLRQRSTGRDVVLGVVESASHFRDFLAIIRHVHPRIEFLIR